MYTDKCTKLAELCQAEIDATAKYAEFGNNYIGVVSEHRACLRPGYSNCAGNGAGQYH